MESPIHVRTIERKPFVGVVRPGSRSLRGWRPSTGAAIAVLACFLPLTAFSATVRELPKKLLHFSFEDET